MRARAFRHAFSFACAGVLLALVVPAAAREDAAAADQAEMAEAQAIIEVMFPAAKRDEQMREMITAMTSQFTAAIDMSRITDAGMRAILEDYLAEIPDRLMPLVNDHLPRMSQAMAVAYVNEFTLEELRDIHNFASTPSGGRFLFRSSALIGDPAIAAANTEYLARVQQLNGQMVAGLQQRLRDYVASQSGSSGRQSSESR